MTFPWRGFIIFIILYIWENPRSTFSAKIGARQQGWEEQTCAASRCEAVLISFWRARTNNHDHDNILQYKISCFAEQETNIAPSGEMSPLRIIVGASVGVETDITGIGH